MFSKAMDNYIQYTQRARLSAQSWAKRKKNRRRCTLHLLWHSETTVASAIFRSLREYENIKQIERVEDKWKELEHTYICCISNAFTILFSLISDHLHHPFFSPSSSLMSERFSISSSFPYFPYKPNFLSGKTFDMGGGGGHKS